MPIDPKKINEMQEVIPREQSAGKSNEDLLAFLMEEGHTTSEVKDFLGVKQVSAHSRLTRLEEKGLAFRMYDEDTKKQYWFNAELKQ